MPNLLNFIDIEESLQKVVEVPLGRYASEVKRLYIKTYEKEGEFYANRYLAGISFDDALSSRVKKSVDFYLLNALLFGASSVVKPSEIMFRKEGAPEDIMGSVKHVFLGIVTDRLTEYVQRKAAQALDAHIQDEKDELLQKADVTSLALKLNAAVDTSTELFAGLSANLTTSRLASFGFLAQAQVSGVTRYQLEATLDSKTSDICRRLHGRVFEVAASFTYVENILRTRDPESLKSIAPFVKGNKASLRELEHLSSPDLQASGIMSPPFHPRCRTILVKVGEVTTVADFTPVQIIRPVETLVPPVVPDVVDLDNKPEDPFHPSDLEVAEIDIDTAENPLDIPDN